VGSFTEELDKERIVVGEMGTVGCLLFLEARKLIFHGRYISIWERVRPPRVAMEKNS
jgi:hypothetical protein